jgi:general secretion pathway protein C
VKAINDNRRMVSNGAANWTVRGLTFLMWALAAASAAYWGLKLATSNSSVGVVPANVRAPAPADPAVVARLLGHTGSPAAAPAAAAPSTASRFQLVGVVADRSQQGAALIVVDGKPAKPYRVGTQIEDGLVLQSVAARRAVLAASVDGPAVATLELPAPAQAPLR